MKGERNLEEIYDAAKAYNYMKEVSVGSFVDANDGANWRVAEIKKVTETTIDFHYEAWSAKYDKKDELKSSDKIAPFRSMTVGYTGQSIGAYRNDFSYSSAVLHKYEEEIKKAIAQEFKLECTPARLSQFFRGELYLYLDSLVTMMDFYKPNIEALQEIFGLFGLVMDLIVKWIQCFPSYKLEHDTCRTRHKLLYLVDLPTSVAMCYPEFAEFLKICFGSDKKRLPASYKVLMRFYFLVWSYDIDRR